MTKTKRSKKNSWSYSAGERGSNRVRAFEKSGKLFVEYYDSLPGCTTPTRRRIAIPGSDREQAKAKAEELSVAFRQNQRHDDGRLTLEALFDIYEREVTPTKGASKQRHDRTTFKLFLHLWGKKREVTTLNRRDWDRFIQARRNGEIRPDETRVKKVRDRTIAYDLKAVLAVLNWATIANDQRGNVLLQRNPLKGYPLPVEANPIRQAFSREQYRALVKSADEIHPLFKVAVIVAHYTGHRIGAIRQLRWSDLDFAKRTIRWRGEHDKIGKEHITPMSRELVGALKHTQRTQQAIGDSWVFPSPQDATQPCSRHLMRDWIERGLKTISISPGQRYGWHSFRRQFATELKDTPLPDLCALGGWTDAQTILKCYAQPDQQTMQTALDNRMRIVANAR